MDSIYNWFAYELTGSAFLVALMTAARLAPTVLGPFAGAIADKMNRRNFMFVSMLLQLVSATILAILVATGLIQFWHLLLIGFLQGLSQTSTYVAGYALALDVAGEKHITNAMSLITVANDIPMIIGPALGGVLVATLGVANCIWMSNGMVLVGAFVIFMLKAPAVITVAQESVLRKLAEGFRYVIHNRDMLAVLSVSLAANIFVFPAYQSFMPVFAKDNLGLGAGGLGFLMTAWGAGALIGALILASLGNFKRKGLIYLWGTGLLAVFFGAFAISRQFPLAMTLAALAGFMSASFGTMQGVLMLMLAPENMRGRSSGFLRLAISIYSPAAVGWGVVANVIGASLATAISCSILATIIVAIAIGMPNLRRL